MESMTSYEKNFKLVEIEEEIKSSANRGAFDATEHFIQQRNLIINDIQKAANNCCGENAPDLEAITKENALKMRNAFLENVSYNGRDSHEDIISVLVFMAPYIKE